MGEKPSYEDLERIIETQNKYKKELIRQLANQSDKLRESLLMLSNIVRVWDLIGPMLKLNPENDWALQLKEVKDFVKKHEIKT